MRVLAISISLCLGLLTIAQLFAREEPADEKLPGIVLWAWKRPENLDFINPQKVAVAFLAESMELSGDRVSVYPRLQPLTVPKGTKLIAVVRLTTNRIETPALSGRQMETSVGHILAVVKGVCGVQIDFDATLSQRRFYRSLLDTLRSRLPDSISLSITALASWCISDTWITGLHIDDAVPMLFRLGPDRLKVLHYLEEGNDFTIPLCRHSIGVSTDEPFPRLAYRRRVYAFSPRPWTKESFHTLVRRIRNKMGSKSGIRTSAIRTISISPIQRSQRRDPRTILKLAVKARKLSGAFAPSQYPCFYCTNLNLKRPVKEPDL